MLSNFNKTLSLNQLFKYNPKGQIATVLILMIVAVLIAILVTVNLGQVSLTATNLANSADSAALLLASQLATQSTQLYKAVGGYKECKKGGWASIIFAIVLAVIVIVIIIVSWGTATAPALGAWLGVAQGTALIVGGAIGGAIGGGIGAAYQGTSVAQGVFQGAAIGAMMGYGAGGIVGAEFGAGAGAAATSAEGLGTFSGLAPAATLGTEATAMGILGLSATIYNADVASQNQASAFSAAAKILSGLPQYHRIRESVFLNVFGQTVDDPNKEPDVDDLDVDGEVDDKISHFLNWWESRVKELKRVVPILESLTKTFVQSTLPAFKDYLLEAAVGAIIQETIDDTLTDVVSPGLLVRYESIYPKYDGWPPGLIYAEDDGKLVWFARTIERESGIDVSFWKPGTPSEAAADYLDEIDAMVSQFKDSIALIDDYISLEDYVITRLAVNFESWANYFYDPTSTWTLGSTTAQKDIYDVFQNAVKPGLTSWVNEIKRVRSLLPECSKGRLVYTGGDPAWECQECLPPPVVCPKECLLTSGVGVQEPPCMFNKDDLEEGGTLDTTFLEHINQLIGEVDSYNAGLEPHLAAIQAYYENMKATLDSVSTSIGGVNPAVYDWTDSRGEHNITVQVSNYTVASTKNTSSGGWLKKESCIELVNYNDLVGDNTWVKVTRKDPAGTKEIGSGIKFGVWNPFLNQGISRTSKAIYDVNRVELKEAK